MEPVDFSNNLIMLMDVGITSNCKEAYVLIFCFLPFFISFWLNKECSPAGKQPTQGFLYFGAIVLPVSELDGVTRNEIRINDSY